MRGVAVEIPVGFFCCFHELLPAAGPNPWAGLPPAGGGVGVGLPEKIDGQKNEMNWLSLNFEMLSRRVFQTPTRTTNLTRAPLLARR